MSAIFSIFGIMRNPVVKIKKKSSNKKIKKTVLNRSRNLEIRSLFTVAKENRKEFESFMKSKGCEITTKVIETKNIPFGFSSFFGYFELPITQIICPNGLLKDFQVHFEKHLELSREFNAERDFALFVISYLNPQKVSKKVASENLNKIKEHGGGRPISKEMKLLLAWKEQNPSLTARKMAVQITNDDKKIWIQQKIEKGIDKTEATKGADSKFNEDFITERRINISKALQHHKSKKTKQKSNKKYFQDTENYLSVFRTGNNYFIISSHGDKTAES